MPQKTESKSDLEETLTAGATPLRLLDAASDAPTAQPKKDLIPAKKKPMPKLKVEANIKEFRVAIIEAVDEPQPQALTLKVFQLKFSCLF